MGRFVHNQLVVCVKGFRKILKKGDYYRVRLADDWCVAIKDPNDQGLDLGTFEYQHFAPATRKHEGPPK